MPPAVAPGFDADQPVKVREADRYNRYPFAEGVARLITSLPRSECYTIGINAPWGDGKTTVLNFVAECLKKDGVAITGYNPWLYGDSTSMIHGLFTVLARAMRLELKKKGETLASNLARLGALAAPFDDRVDKLRQALKEKGDVPLEEVRARLLKQFRKADKRVVVFIDDIDRLEATETVSLLRTLKACADLPGVVYVLAFDREVVAEIVGSQMAIGGVGGGHRYLEKIIQVSLSVPPALPTDLSRVCHEAIDAILQHNQFTVSDDDQQRWRSAFDCFVSRRLRTPRNVSQYSNAVRFALPMLRGEANAVDLLLIEALRVFSPAAYQIVRTNFHEFVEPSGRVMRSWVPNTERAVVTSLRAALPASEFNGVFSLLTDIFPLFTLDERASSGNEPHGDWMRARRASSRAYVTRYFTYAVAPDDVSEEAIRNLIAIAEAGHSRLHAELGGLLTGVNQVMLLEKLELAASAASVAATRRLAVALAVAAISFDEPFSLYRPLDPGVMAARLAVRLTARGPDAEWVPTAISVIDESPDWFVGAYFERLLPKDMDTSSPRVAEAVTTVSRAFGTRFNRMARSADALLDLNRRWRFEMIFQYGRAAGRDAAQELFTSRLQNGDSVIPLLLQLAALPVSRFGEVMPIPGSLEPRHLDDLQLIVDVVLLHERARKWAFTTTPLRSDDGVRRDRTEDTTIREFQQIYPIWSAAHTENQAALERTSSGQPA